MIKLKSNRDMLNLGVLVPGGKLRYFKKKGDTLELTDEEAKNFTVEVNLEGGFLDVIGSKPKVKKEKVSKETADKKAFSNESPSED